MSFDALATLRRIRLVSSVYSRKPWGWSHRPFSLSGGRSLVQGQHPSWRILQYASICSSSVCTSICIHQCSPRRCRSWLKRRWWCTTIRYWSISLLLLLIQARLSLQPTAFHTQTLWLLAPYWTSNCGLWSGCYRNQSSTWPSSNRFIAAQRWDQLRSRSSGCLHYISLRWIRQRHSLSRSSLLIRAP